MLCPVVMGKLQCVPVTDAVLHLEVQHVLMREWSWLLGKLANIHGHPWALWPHQRCGRRATSTSLIGDDFAGNLLGDIGRKVVEDVVHPSSNSAVMLVARQQSGQTFRAGCECDRGRLWSTFWPALELGVPPLNTNVALTVVFLARVTLKGASFAQETVVDPRHQLTGTAQL